MAQKILDIQIGVASWRRIPRLQARLQAAAAKTLELVPFALPFPVSATVLLAGDAAVRRLNTDFRGIDKPTNVLSFPQYEPKDLRRLGRHREAVSIGDIVLAYRYVCAEAKRDDKILIDHATHLVIHGLLHLLGFDHIKERDADRMEALEAHIMRALGLPDPYAFDGKK